MLRADARGKNRIHRPVHNPHTVPLDAATPDRQTCHVQFALAIQHFERVTTKPTSAVYHVPADREGVRP